MIDLILLGEGWVLGFLIAAPIGPVGLLCFERSIRTGFLAGIASGLGAALADGFYAAAAGFGIIAITNFFKAHGKIIAFCGCVLLIGMGIHSLLHDRTRNTAANAQTGQNSGTNAVVYTVQTFVITIANPATIMSFIAAFSSIGILQETRDFSSAALSVAGMFLGSLSWWLVLCGGALTLRHRLPDKTVSYVNKAMAIGLIFFGCILLFGYL